MLGNWKRLRRGGIAALCGTVLAAGLALLPAPPAVAAPAKPKVGADLPLLKSPPAPKVPLTPNGSGHVDPLKPVKKTSPSFDPVRSVAIPELTTEDRLTYVNPDGTRTVVVNSGPVRFRTPLG